MPHARSRSTCLLAVTMLLLASVDVSAAAGMDVLHYEARLQLDMASRSLVGEERIVVRPSAGQTTLVFDAGALVIDAASEAGVALAFDKTQSKVSIQLAQPARAGERREIGLRYHGVPASGLVIHPDTQEAYTIFSTSQWLVSVDAPAERATLDLSLLLPDALQAVGTGRASRPRRVQGGLTRHRWRLERPMPAYVYGFAAGRLHSASARVDGVVLDFHSSSVDRADLARAFADTGDMLRFFQARSGLHYGHARYSQVLVSETIGQEMAGMSVLSEAYGREVLADPATEGLIAHELAHQWWGNRITCQDWGHFWLNEAFATFMSAAYLQQRFGTVVYDKQVDAWRQRVDALRLAGKDHALVYAQWRPTRDDRAVVYQKGAYVLHLLRQDLGERDFWRGLRAYSRAHDGESVTTEDFQRAMEQASGRDLGQFFRRWVLDIGDNAPPGDSPHPRTRS